MLTQAQVDSLLQLVKILVDRGRIDFPPPGTIKTLEVKSENGRESFLIDINRKGKIKISKCTYQERYQVIEILLRLDLDGPPHENPDGIIVPCPHLHIYREGFADKWAAPIAPSDFTDTTDLIKTLKEFLAFCKVRDIPDVLGGLF
jgi:hypothetical protein